MSLPFGPNSQRAYCPECNENIRTNVKRKATIMAHIIAVILCIFGWCPCAACVYCSDCAYKTEHYCPFCGSYLGYYDPL